MSEESQPAPAPVEAKVQKVQLRALCNFTCEIEGKIKQHQFLWVPPERADQLVNVVRCCVKVERHASRSRSA